MFPNRHDSDENPLLSGLRPETAAWLQEGLRDLRDVPEHGLSNERLRDRLLATGLDAKPASPATPWWAWALAPAAAALVVLAVVPGLSGRLRRENAPQLVLTGESSVAKVPASTPLALDRDRLALLGPKTPVLQPPSASGRSSATQPRTPVAVPRTDPNPGLSSSPASAALSAGRVRAASPRRRRASTSVRPAAVAPRPSAPRSAEAAAPDPKTLLALNDVAGSVAAGLLPASASTPVAPPIPLASMASVSSPETSARSLRSVASLTAKPTRSTVAKPDPLVILASEIDADTGAVAATEVDSHKNVSVGG